MPTEPCKDCADHRSLKLVHWKQLGLILSALAGSHGLQGQASKDLEGKVDQVVEIQAKTESAVSHLQGEVQVLIALLPPKAPSQTPTDIAEAPDAHH